MRSGEQVAADPMLPIPLAMPYGGNTSVTQSRALMKEVRPGARPGIPSTSDVTNRINRANVKNRPADRHDSGGAMLRQ